MSSLKLSTAIAGAMLLAALPAGAATWINAVSDADFAAQNASNAFTTYGSAIIQIGRPNAANWEVGVKDATGRLLQYGDVPWAPLTNSLATSGTTPLLSYSSLGKLTTTFSTNGIKYSKSGTVTTGADTLWIRGIIMPKAYATTLVLAGLQIKYTGGVWIDLDSLDATASGAYLGFSDPKLATGFSLRYGFGYFNNSTYDGVDAIPSFTFMVGKYATPLDPNIAPWDRPSAPAPATFDIASGSDLETARLAIAGSANPGGVPEPASWAMLITGFGLTGGTLRRRRSALA